MSNDQVSLVVSVLGLLLAGAATVPAFMALTRSRQANSIASDANSIAEANERRATESYDVEWRMGYIDEHHLFVENIGLDSAWGVRYRIELPSGSMRADGPEVVEAWSHFPIGWEVAMTEESMDDREITLRIVWASPAGAPHSALIRTPARDVFRHGLAFG